MTKMNKEEFIEKVRSKIEQVNEYGAMGIRRDSLLDLEEWVDHLLQAERERCAVKVKNLYLQLTGREKGSRHLVQQSGKGMRDSYNLALADSAKTIREEK